MTRTTSTCIPLLGAFGLWSAALVPAQSTTVQFTVSDEFGRPVAGAGLVWGLPHELDAAEIFTSPMARSDAKGTLSVVIRPARDGRRRYALIGAAGRATRFLRVRIGVGMRDAAQGTIVLPKGIDITGLVLDDKGKPFAGARIEASDILIAPHLRISTLEWIRPHFGTFAASDAKGIFRLRGVLPMGASVTARAPGYHLGRANFANAHRPLVIRLRKGGFVAGRVVNAEGQPFAADVRVLYEAGEDHLSIGRTNADGRYRINLDFPGRYRVAARPADRGEKAPWSHSRIVTSAQTNLEVVTPRSLTAIDVEVVDASTKKPIEAFHAVATWFDPATPRLDFRTLANELRARFQCADRSGHVALPGPDEGDLDTGSILVRARGYAAHEVPGVAWDDSEKNHGYRVELVRESTIHGIVRDAVGKPVTGALAFALRLDRARRTRPFALSLFDPTRAPVCVVTDLAGKFRFDQLGPGRYELRVKHATQPDSNPKRITLKAQERATVEMRLEPGSTLRGRIVGAPVGSGWVIRLGRQLRSHRDKAFAVAFGELTEGMGSFLQAAVQRDGSFEIRDLSRGKYLASLLVPGAGGYHETLERPLRSIRVGRDDLEVVFEVNEYLAGTLAGKVTFSGAVLPPGRLVLVAIERTLLTAFAAGVRGGESFELEFLGHRAAVGTDGSYSLRVLPGEYGITAIDLATGAIVGRSKKRVRVDSEDSAHLDVDLALSLVRVTLLPYENEAIVASRLQCHVASVEEDDLMDVSGIQVKDRGTGLLLQPGVREFTLYLPTQETRLEVRSEYFNLFDNIDRNGAQPIGEYEFTPELGKVRRIKVRIRKRD